MSKSLEDIAKELRAANKKVQLIYAFNGTGKTRLSREFKKLVAPKDFDESDKDDVALSREKFLYYNAFTEDLFYWDNDLVEGAAPKLKIQPNTYTDWLLTLLKDLGQDGNIVEYFQHFANDKLTPHFSEDFAEVTFTLERGDDKSKEPLKISKGEESNFIWSVFYTLLDQVIEVLNVAEPSDRETDQFDQLEYIFIDDPVSSLDDNHLIQLAVDLAETIKLNDSEIKFIITTHNPLFFNILCNEFQSDDRRYIGERRINWKSRWFNKYRLEKSADETNQLIPHPNDAPFSYHLRLMRILQEAAETGLVEKYHFSFLRNIFEKAATFLGYKRWEMLLPETGPGRPNAYLKRILNFSSHSKHSAEEIAEPGPQDAAMLLFLINHLVAKCGFEQSESWDG